MKVLTIDVGGTHVKILVSGESACRQFDSGPALRPKRMVRSCQDLAEGWDFDVISIGYPGPVAGNRPLSEPHNLGRGWVGFDFEDAFKRPVRLINDAAMQALGSYRDGKMLFLGLGTGLGSAMIVDGIVEPMELGHLPYRKRTYEDYVGQRGLDRNGKRKWQKDVLEIVAILVAALEPQDVVIGGGNARHIQKLPKGYRAGDNANAFLGGFRLWENADNQEEPGTRHRVPAKSEEQPHGHS